MVRYSIAGGYLLLASAHLTLASVFVGRHPMITAAPDHLGKRQAQCAASTNTLCPNDFGCCPSGSPCTFNAQSQAICASAKCDSPAVLCAGPQSDICCNPGSSCNPSSAGLCAATASDNLFPMPSITGDPEPTPSSAPPSSAPPSSTPSPTPVPLPSPVSESLTSPPVSTPPNMESAPVLTNDLTGDVTTPPSTSVTSASVEESSSTSAAPSSESLAAANPLASPDPLSGGLVTLVVGAVAGLFAVGLV